MISGSSFMTDDRFATYRVWCRFVQYKTGKIMEELQFIAKFVYNVAKRVLMQLQPKIWKETSAGSYNLLNVKIIVLLFTTGNFYCLLTRLRKPIKVLVVSTCAKLSISNWTFRRESRKLLQEYQSRSWLYWPDPRNVYHEFLNQTLTGSTDKSDMQPTGYCGTLGLCPPSEMEGWEGFAS